MDGNNIEIADICIPPDSNNLIVMPQLLKTQSTQDLCTPADLCRICLANDGQLISPCRCKGSIEKVHEICLKKWILNGKNYDCFTYDTQREIKCQICHHQIVFYLYKKKKCGLQSFRRNMKFQRVFVIIHIVLILMFIACICLMAKAISDTVRKSGNLQMQQPTFIAVCTVCGIISFFLGGLIYRLIIQNFIYTKFIISKILTINDLRQKQWTRQGSE